MGDMKIKVAIADDHPLVIDGLYHILGNCTDMEITGSYNNGAELLRGIAKEQPDVLLLDIQMPGKTGDELAGIISEQYPQVRILALTNQDSVYYIKTMLRRGVCGYVLKTSREEILLEAIRTVSLDKQYLPSAIQDKIAQDRMHVNETLSANPVLSRRETEVLRYIAKDFTSQEIADKLNVSKRTIDNHRVNLMLKLGVKNVAALVVKAMQMGLIE